jgi:nucleoside-diphosphate-sugar epimerase
VNVTVLGATGGIGRAIVTELAHRGPTVTAASRSAATSVWPTGVRALPTDLRDQTSARAACQDADVVVMAAQIPYSGWVTELTPLVDAAIDAAGHAGARLVMVDNLYGYGFPDGPITEASPLAATTRKGRLRAELGERLLQAHADGRVRVTIGRFSDYYGPGGENSLLNQVGVKPAVAGKTARVFIAGDQPHTFHFLPDAARGFATLVEHPEADGRIWILPAAPAVTQDEMYRLLGEVVGPNLKVGRITPTMLRMIGLVNRELKEALEVVGQFDRPYVTDASAFEATFGPLEVTDHREALAATVAWARALLQQQQQGTEPVTA